MSQEFVKPLEEFYKAKKIGKGSEAIIEEEKKHKQKLNIILAY